MLGLPVPHFPSFSEGLSLRSGTGDFALWRLKFPFLFGGTFIEDFDDYVSGVDVGISLPFRRDFH